MMADEEKGTLLDTSEEEPVDQNRFRNKYFSCWRSVFLYHRNADFAESLEISFRGACWLLLFGSPAIWGLTTDAESWFHADSTVGKMFQTGAIVSFVYTLAPTVGVTLSYAVDGVAGTVVAAIFSRFMYLWFPDGCSGAEPLSPCYFFGAVVGAASIIFCLVAKLNTSFQIFYCANFVWFNLAFMNPDSPLRSAPDAHKEHIFGFEFVDWGGGVFDGVIKMVSGAALAVLVTLLPYPMTSMEQARDSAADLVRVLEKTWTNSVDFYLENDKDERHRAKMMGSVSSIKGHIAVLSEHLAGSWWEMFFAGPCSRSFRSKHFFLSKLEETTSRCFERLSHVVDACAREQFEDTHDQLMGRCGNAVKELSSSANSLLRLAAKLADDGEISTEDGQKLLQRVEQVEKAEVALTKEAKKAMDELVKKHPKFESSTDQAWLDVSRDLADERIFMFSLCDYASSVQAYSKWLAECPSGCAPVTCCDWGAQLRTIFDKDAMKDSTNINVALRSSLAMFIGFTVGYYGYGELISSRDATIPCTIAVLLSKSVTSPLSKSFGRLLGVVLGKFCGKLAYALLGWCLVWAQVSLSVVIFSYAWLSLFVYYYTSSFSHLGCLAAAFGTQVFLQGCADEVVVEATARTIVNMVVAIGIMVVVDMFLTLGRPSALAFGAYLDAWATWDDMLEDLLTDKDTSFDPVKIIALINNAEALGAEAEAEPRLWRSPFPSELYANMIALAKTMRRQVVCIHTVICEKEPGKDGKFSKKIWFKDLLSNEASKWPERIKELLGEMDNTHDLIDKLEETNGEKIPKKIGKRKRENIESRLANLEFPPMKGRGLEDDAQFLSLVEDEEAQQNFIFGCMQSIFAVNYNMQLEMLRAGVM